jgi:hypothetical protein
MCFRCMYDDYVCFFFCLVEIFFKIKTHTPLKKLMDAYCQKESIPMSNAKFLYENLKILLILLIKLVSTDKE